MNIRRWTRKFGSSFKALRFWKWTAEDFRKVGVDTRYASEIVKPDSPGTPAGKLVKYPLQDIIRHNKESIEHTNRIIALEKQLEVTEQGLDAALGAGVRCLKQAEAAEKALEAAAGTFALIDCMAVDTRYSRVERLGKMQQLARDGYRAAKN